MRLIKRWLPLACLLVLGTAGLAVTTIDWNTQIRNRPTIVSTVFGASGVSHAVGLVPDPGVTPGTAKYLREDASWQTIAPTSSSGAAGSVQIAGAAGAFDSDATALFWDKTNHRLGIGTAAPLAPLAFPGTTGAKISIFDNGTASFGFGVQSGVMQMYAPPGNSIDFGSGTSGAFTPYFRVITGVGVQIFGVTAPSAPSAGFTMYVDNADNKLKVKSYGGTVTTLALP